MADNFQPLERNNFSEFCENGCSNPSTREYKGFCKKCYDEFQASKTNEGDRHDFFKLLAEIFNDDKDFLAEMAADIGLYKIGKAGTIKSLDKDSVTD
jgi:hypothetical protein